VGVNEALEFWEWPRHFLFWVSADDGSQRGGVSEMMVQSHASVAGDV
jgi:hypothetical protein